MKAFLFVVGASATLCAVSVRAEDCCEARSVSVEQRIRDIDIDIALKQYELIQKERAKCEVGILMAEIQPGSEEREEQIKLLHRRLEVLQLHAAEMKHRILSLAKEEEAAAK